MTVVVPPLEVTSLLASLCSTIAGMPEGERVSPVSAAADVTIPVKASAAKIWLVTSYAPSIWLITDFPIKFRITCINTQSTGFYADAEFIGDYPYP